MDWVPADERNAKAGEAAKKDVLDLLRILDESLGSKPYLLGADYTLVDTHLNSLVDWLRMMKFDLSAFANMNAWSARCTARPAYAKVMGAHA